MDFVDEDYNDISKVGPRPPNSSPTISGLERELRNILRQQKNTHTQAKKKKLKRIIRQQKHENKARQQQKEKTYSGQTQKTKKD